ncbi:phosphate regulon transcriptional regulatory protein PhoB [Serratia entomophila]|uniref:winged helix-turn-helix domain-containing protein n=1 Tax=Serratia entomophila TaxID=42906 RepID=UPI001F1FD276|nr:winged helix-turn-helix domain-containing protein [Serratia entomophila]UIW18637.1 winged helix-turn-helix domain-containing protein [Serratia entomophila]CAI0817711.1 phosphate regulon transcriptional regulatory protein PhoB [Serratia entomophila]CAI0836095.1 phosphate regulon transcriptional regulatory protein PhoB [Serratia entomophila]CAI0837346.1 phosphate regulon transcriptional regulatory protein PhoB [Serratia entomophila]CAI0878603.1 phosphate regulon transcriptional regulatory pro
MIFHINNNVLYNEDECALAHIDNSTTKIVLLKPSARLLSLFIRNNNVLLLRDKLLNEVWVEHGLKASNNNLNNYISGLRKSLAQFGEEEIIITYPRQGFKFSAEIIHKIDDSSQVDTKENFTPEEVSHRADINLERNVNGNQRSLRRMIVTFVVGLMLFSAMMFYQNSTRVSMYPLGNYERCQIYSMNYGGGDLSKIKQIIQHAGFSCRIKADAYYYDNIRDDANQKDKELLTFCPREVNSPCIYHYINKKQP